ncbi:NAD(P)-dependent alcohol dehydrogenase [Agrococcus jejuensis]|uniref:NADPH:quinone reductase n=1 Tax=Agrococcus jejuensis TaxID=399736 RepID=A0A1G8CSD7_9MICO|nr:NAD(P)-dependent alcohol dehydrogenase [Agrococcus jejuensis]SDH48244.1 NADPH:quinone reductase [Agrococcus jejuensis]
MRAIAFDRYGPPADLRIVDVPEPELLEGRVLVRVEAVGLNPLDWHEVRGDPWMLRLQRGLRVAAPRVAGADLAGTVVAVADDVTGVAVGDRVVGSTASALAEVARVRVESLAVLPPEVSSEAAAALPVAGVTALQALRDVGALQAGERVLVWGASGGVGHLAVQLARILGAARVEAVASPARAVMLRDLGVDVVHDRDAATPAGPFDVVIDTVSTASVATLQGMLAPGGRVVTVGGLGGGRLLGPLASLVRRSVVGVVRRVHLRGMLAQVRSLDLAQLVAWTASGALRPVVAEVVPFDAAPDALALLEQGHVAGKLVVRVDRAEMR